jgi:hypothetical protein
MAPPAARNRSKRSGGGGGNTSVYLFILALVVFGGLGAFMSTKGVAPPKEKEAPAAAAGKGGLDKKVLQPGAPPPLPARAQASGAAADRGAAPRGAATSPAGRAGQRCPLAPRRGAAGRR